MKNLILILGIIVAIPAISQTKQIVVGTNMHIKSTKDLILMPNTSGKLNLLDTTVSVNFVPGDPSVTTLYYSTSPFTPVPPNPTPVTITALNYISMFGISRGADYIGSTDLNDWVQYGFIQSGKFTVSSNFARGETNPATGGKAEVRAGSSTGAILGTLTFRNTGNWNTYVSEKVGEVSVPSGTTLIVLKFATPQGNGNIKNFVFTPQ